MGKKKSRKAIAYIRVSTQKQGASGLGLEAQRELIRSFCQAHGVEVVTEYKEIESGKNGDRPELAKALAKCRATKSLLLIAKLDRLARKLSFVSALMDSSVEFVCCDFPEANRLTLHILAAVAEYEAQMCSERVTAALAAAKARGVKLGNPKHLSPEGRLKGSQTTKQRAAKRHEELMPTILRLEKQGYSVRQIGEQVGTSHMTVMRILQKAV